VNIELFPMSKPTSVAFDVNKFYADLISMDEDDVVDGFDGVSAKLGELMNRIRQKEFRKRTLGRCMFSITPKTEIAIRVYNMIHPAKKPSAAFIDSETNKPLKSTTRWICEESGSTLYPNQIGNFFPLGKEKVKLSKGDLSDIKKFDTVGIKLMGFKPKRTLKDYHNIRTAYFLYPDDTRVTNSSQCMDALIESMIKKDKIAIVRFIPRDTSIMRFCALIP
jgi:ATP-dependent DNA helicase 2 subunit 1